MRTDSDASLSELCGSCLNLKGSSKYCSESGYLHNPAVDGSDKIRSLSSRLGPRMKQDITGFKRQSVTFPDDASDDPFSNKWDTFRSASSGPHSRKNSAKRNSSCFNEGELTKKRNMSIATFAVNQFKANKLYTDNQAIELDYLQEQADELQTFVDNKESWLDTSGFRLGQFQADCLQAIIAKKAAARLLKGIRSRSIAKLEDEPGCGGRGIRRTLIHRSVLKKGPMMNRFEDAKKIAYAEATARANKIRKGEQTDIVSVSGRPWSAPVGRRRLTGTASGRIRPTRPASAATCPPHPSSSPRLADSDDEIIKRSTPAFRKWQSRCKHGNNDPTMMAFAGSQADNLKVLTTRIDWSSLLDQQKDQFKKLEIADDGYRTMLDRYEKYQQIVQRRLDALLALDTLVPGLKNV